MLLFRMKAVITLICAFTIHGLASFVAADFKCPEGKRIKQERRDKNPTCEPCSEGYYQDKPNDTQDCRDCTHCKEERYSKEVSKCSTTSDTRCECLPGFVKKRVKSDVCMCDLGSGLTGPAARQSCSECQDGYFTAEINTPCTKWQECKNSGVKVNGNKTSDVICNDESDRTQTPRSTPASPSPSTQITSSTTRTLDRGRPSHSPKQTEGLGGSNRDGIIPLIIGIPLLLLIIVTFIFAVTHCMKKRPELKATKDSMCRSPVEESGDSSLSSLVKSGSGEP